MLLQISASSASTAVAGIATLAVLAPSSLPAAPDAAAGAVAEADVADDALHFTRFDRLKGGPVHGPGREELGTLEDLVIDCCSGDIRFLILDRGSALGLGATWLALPWSRTSPAPTSPAATPTTTPPPTRSAPPEPTPAEQGVAPRPVLVVSVTPEQLERMPTFDSTEDATLEINEWVAAMQQAFDDFDDWQQRDRADPFAGSLNLSEQVTIAGEIARIRRDRSLGGAEHIIVEIRADEGRRVVALGPAWYVMGRAKPPMRSDDISIDGWAIEGHDDIDAVARSATVGEADIPLRRENGTARWASGASEQSPGVAHPALQADRLTLASRIVGASATANAQDAGEIKRLVIEQATGVVAFLEVDPDANFLGLAENTQIVPWEAIANVAPGRVRFDATAQMLAGAPDSPDDGTGPAWFADGANRNRVYEQFELPARRFQTDGGE